MGALQLELPSPKAMSKQWPLIVIDLKDCFFTTPLHPSDHQKFAFSVPSVNFKKSMKRYQWMSFPKELKNSQVLYQHFVGQILKNAREHFPQTSITRAISYQHLTKSRIYDLFVLVKRNSKAFGLCIAPDKVHCFHLFLAEQMIRPQKIKIRQNLLLTFNDFKSCSEILIGSTLNYVQLLTIKTFL